MEQICWGKREGQQGGSGWGRGTQQARVGKLAPARPLLEAGRPAAASSLEQPLTHSVPGGHRFPFLLSGLLKRPKEVEEMRVSMGSLQDHCPSLSPLFPWLQDALPGSASPPTHAFSVPLPRLHTGHRPRLIRSLCLSLPFLTLCGPISTAEATRRLSSKIPHRRVPSRFPSRCFSASPGACRPLHLDLCPAPAPAPESPPQTEIRPLASKVRLDPTLLLAPQAPGSRWT